MNDTAIEAALRGVRPEAGELHRLREGVVDGAEREHLIELAYCEVDSPFGRMLAAATGRGLAFLSFPEAEEGAILDRLAREISPRILRAPARLDPVRAQLSEYFEGARSDFDLALDWQLSSGFRRAVLERANRIPYGQTRTYSQMAEAAGSPRAHRAAGSALGANPIPIVVPCHRVLRIGGALGGYGGGLEVKRRLLELEGVL